MDDPEKRGLKERVASLSTENKVLRDEVSDLRALIEAYRKWIKECPLI